MNVHNGTSNHLPEVCFNDVHCLLFETIISYSLKTSFITFADNSSSICLNALDDKIKFCYFTRRYQFQDVKSENRIVESLRKW